MLKPLLLTISENPKRQKPDVVFAVPPQHLGQRRSIHKQPTSRCGVRVRRQRATGRGSRKSQHRHPGCVNPDFQSPPILRVRTRFFRFRVIRRRWSWGKRTAQKPEAAFLGLKESPLLHRPQKCLHPQGQVKVTAIHQNGQR